MPVRRDVWVRPLADEERLASKQSFATRRVPKDAMHTLVGGAIRPRAGDIVLARVARLGHHKHIEQPHGRRSVLHEGDTLIAAYANRYATDQFESYVPRTLGPVQFVASGGIASKVASRSRSVRAATDIVPLGLVGDEKGRPINVADFALPRVLPPEDRPLTVAVVGTSMNAGKTTTLRYILHGLSKVGLRPGATKVTGTGSGNDYWVMLDSGAHAMLDFTDAGLAATFGTPIPRLEDAMDQLVAHLSLAGCGVNLVEIADGVFQQENRRLFRSPLVHGLIDAVVLAASDAMGAVQGVRSLTEYGFNVVAVSGLISKSPLATREAREALGLPVLGLDELVDPQIMAPLLGLSMADFLPIEEASPPAWPVTVPGLTLVDTEQGAADELDGLGEGFVGSHELRSAWPI